MHFIPGTSVDIHFFELILIAMVVKRLSNFFVLIWGIHARFAKKMVNISQLILSLIIFQSDHDDSRLLSEQTEKWKNVINQNYN